MTVFMTLTGIPSNKQGEVGKAKKAGKIRYKDISYVPMKGQVAVLKPIIDKISITYVGHPDLKAVLVQNLLQEIEAGNHWESAPFKKGPVLYQASARLVIPSSGHSVVVQAGPKKKTTTHTLRLEFNPTALGGPGIAFLKSKLEALVLDGLSFTDIIVNGRVTRADIAVDIVGVHLADLLIAVNGGGKQHWYLSAEGKPETGYLGIKPSNKNAKWTAYNKRQELKDNGKKQFKDSHVLQAYGGLSHTRIEYRATPMKSFPELGSLENPLLDISLAYPERPKRIEPYVWTFFVDSCARRGQSAALEMLPEGPIRKKFEKAVGSLHTTFWRPDEIWKAWDKALVESGLLHP